MGHRTAQQTHEEEKRKQKLQQCRRKQDTIPITYGQPSGLILLLCPVLGMVLSVHSEEAF